MIYTGPPTDQFLNNNIWNLKWLFQAQQPLERSSLQLLPLEWRHLTINLDNDISLHPVSHSKLKLEEKKNKQVTTFSGTTHLKIKSDSITHLGSKYLWSRVFTKSTISGRYFCTQVFIQNKLISNKIIPLVTYVNHNQQNQKP